MRAAVQTIPIDRITIGERHRKSLGDLEGLAASIRDLGLLQPIGVTSEHKLLFGHRRLEAAKLVPLTEIEARVFRKLDDAVKALKVERDENTCRKDFTKSEAVALGRELEKLERVQAKERKAATQAKPGDKVGAVNFTAPSDTGYTRDKVGAAIGMSGVTYQRAKTVIEAAEEDPEKYGHLVEQMDATGKVQPAYSELKKLRENRPRRQSREEREKQIKRLASDGHRAAQIADELGIGIQRVRELARDAGITLPDAAIGKTRRINAHRIVSETVNGLAGYVIGLQTINGGVSSISQDDAAAWVESLKESLPPLQKLKKQLERIANGN